ncbi:MAG: P-loop NTPase fold protein, partial [Bacteroidota bacterium]
MKIKHQHIEIPNDGSDPFVNCKLERKQYAKVLTGIVQNYAEGFVLAIDNNWGTGKTTFIKMWRQELTNERFETLYFNAWENDFQEEVIIALLSELQELKPDKGRTFDSLLEKTATFMKKVGPAVIKGAVSKALGDDATADIATAVMEYTSEQVEEQLFAFNEKKKGIQDFRNILEKYVDEIDDEKPVVFFIDELDRCRPSYSVEVLEQIKHLFSVPGIVFVLSVDKVQLGNAVRGFYGSDLINADEYLRRFIDLEYNIPSPSYQKFFSYLYAYFDFDSFLSSKERLTYPNLQDDKHRFLKFASRLFHHSKLSLRQIEKVMSQIRIG